MTDLANESDGEQEVLINDRSQEAGLSQYARDALRSGKVPRRPPEATWGGPGTGLDCAICGRSIGNREMEFEVTFSEFGASYHFHVRCFAAWELECYESTGADRDAGGLRPDVDAATILARESQTSSNRSGA